MKKLEFDVEINAPKRKVWDTMLNEKTYREWVSESWPNSFYEGSWTKGENIRFIGNDGSGTLATVTELKDYETVAVAHIAALLPGGVEDRDSAEAKTWIGTKESYYFTERNGKTNLKVIMSVATPEWEEMLAKGWPAALDKLKVIAEH